jgi:hypothetical protein
MIPNSELEPVERKLAAFRRLVGISAFCSWCLFALSGCSRTDEACTKARLDASDHWKNVYEQAAAAKNKGGWLEFDDLPQTQKADHVRTWTTVEKQSEMVFKSFAFEKITWKTAAPAREKANEEFQKYFGKDHYALFSAALASANQRFENTANSCKD